MLLGEIFVENPQWYFNMIRDLRINYPSNNFAENLRKFPGIFLRKFKWEYWQPFQGISRNPLKEWVLGISCNPFRGNSLNSIQGISYNQFQGFSCYQFCRKTGENVTKFVEILRNFQWKVHQNQFLGISWKLFPRFSQEFLRNICIFLCKFTNQDLGPIVVNNNYIASPTF